MVPTAARPANHGSRAGQLDKPERTFQYSSVSPLLAKDPLTGKFMLTMKVMKSTDLTNFSPFPFTAGEVAINSDGDLEFRFASQDNAAFFKLSAE